MIKLVPVTKDNIDEVLALDVREDQERFVSPNSESLAQAYVYSETAWPFAIYDDEYSKKSRKFASKYIYLIV